MARLVKHTATIVLAGALLTGCAYDEAARSLRERKTDSESLAIVFDNGLIDRPVTTKAVSMLSDHMNTMGVWGWQNSPEGGMECLFNNQEVTFNATLGKWIYTPVRYWELHSTYKFFAYAPHSGSEPGTKVVIDTTTHAISLKGVTLQGSNTITDGTPQLPARFKQVADADWMIDRTGQSMTGMAHQEVTFNMQHLLSKICVRMTRGDSFPPDSVISLTLDSLTMEGFISQGDFVQDQSFSPGITASEWTPVDTMPRYTIKSARNVSIPDSALYVLESLLIPQDVDTTHYVHIWYTIGHKNGHHDRYDHRFRLNGLFSQFDTGCNYILTAIIGTGVEPITFNSLVSVWGNHDTYLQINNQ